MANKYSFDYHHHREIPLEHQNLDHHALNEKSENVQQEIDDKIKLAEKFEQDKKLIEEQIEIVYNSDLAYEDKKEQLFLLKQMIQVLQNEYTEQVEKVVEKKEEQVLEIADVFEQYAQQLSEQAEKMGAVNLKSGSVYLHEAIEETKRVEEMFQSLREKELAELEKRMEKMTEHTKEMNKNRSRSI